MEQDPLIGTLFAGRFQIQALLGEGGFGRVYLASHTVLKRRFALKVVHGHHLADPTTEARFRREARAASRIDHPNVAYVFDYGKTQDGASYLAMEYVEGPTLADILQQEGALPIGRALEVLAQIAEGIAAAHGCRVVHRDIKPTNIILTDEDGHADRVKILDFGLARAVAGDTWSGAEISTASMVHGTPCYVAPEQFFGTPVDFKTDTYAFGVVAYEVLTGRLPFSGTLKEILAAQVNMRLPPAPSTAAGRGDVPDRLDQLVLRCLDPDPDRRVQDGKALAGEMRSIHRIGREDRVEPPAEHPRPPGAGKVPAILEPATPSAPTVPGAAAGGRSGVLEPLVSALVDRGLSSPEVQQGLARLLVTQAEVLQVESELARLEAELADRTRAASERQARLKRARRLLDDDGASGAGEPLARRIDELLQRIPVELEAGTAALDEQATARREQLTELQRQLPAEEQALVDLLRRLQAQHAEALDQELRLLFDLLGTG